LHLQQVTDDKAKKFGGYTFRRLYPWHGVIDTPWGSGWIVIKPGKRTDPHWHDEEETFMILSGVGEMRVGDQARPVKKGDVVWIPRGEALQPIPRHFKPRPQTRTGLCRQANPSPPALPNSTGKRFAAARDRARISGRNVLFHAVDTRIRRLPIAKAPERQRQFHRWSIASAAVGLVRAGSDTRIPYAFSGQMEDSVGASVSHPRSRNAERSTPGGAYHPAEP
jgi:hypothetical protein